MTDALEVIVNAHKEVSGLDFQNKELINALMMSARRNVAMQLADGSIEGFQEAIDTMSKVKAIEDYIRAKRDQSLYHFQSKNEQWLEELNTQNLVAAERLRIAKSLGIWLIANGEIQGYYDPHRDAGHGPPYSYEELNIDDRKALNWKTIGRAEESDFENWINQFLETAQKKEDELSQNKLLSYLLPRQEAEKKGKLDAEQQLLNQVEFHFYKIKKEVCSGKLSEASLMKSIDRWNKTKKYIDLQLKESGEMF